MAENLAFEKIVLLAAVWWTPCGGTRSNGSLGDATRFHYLGKWQFEGALNANQLLGYRYYFAGWGRFTTPDPTGQESNPYAYAHDDPINHTDPTGTSIFSVIHHVVKDVGACLGGAGIAYEQFGAAVGLAMAASGFGVAAGEIATGVAGCAAGVAGSETIGQDPLSPGPGPF